MGFQGTMRQKDRKTWEPTSRTQALSKYLYRAPEPKYVAPFILIFSLLFGLLIKFDLEGLTYGFFLLALPAYLSALLSTPLVEAFGGKFYYRRSFFTSFIGLLIIGLVLISGTLCDSLIVVNWKFLVIYGYSIVLSMLYLVIRTTCLNYHRYSFIVSSAQSFFVLIMHFLLSLNDLGFLEENNFISLQESSFGILSSLVLFIASLLFVEIVNAPLRTDVGINGTDLMAFFLSYMIEGTKEIESLFVPLQEEYHIPFSIMAIRKSRTAYEKNEMTNEIENEMNMKNGEITPPAKPFHALIIAPSVHPGPLGTIGGGNLPQKLAEPLFDLADHILVPHGAATNDDNPATTEECEKIVNAVREAALGLREEDFSGDVSRIQSKSTDTTLHLLRFGSRGLVISEPMPFVSDDLSLSIFKGIYWEAKYRDIDDIMLIDAHNNSKRGANPVQLGDRISVEIEEIFAELCDMEVNMQELKMGFGSSIPDRGVNGLGPTGVQTIIIRDHEKDLGLVLFDGNNMQAEIRERLRTEAEKVVDRVIIMTADNHIVNATLGGYNPIGENCVADDLTPAMMRSLEQALDDVGESEAAIKSGRIDGINILGFGNTNRLVATINSTVAVIYRAAFACGMLAILASALVYYIV